MIVIMGARGTEADVDRVVEHLGERGLRSQLNRGDERIVIGALGQIYSELQDTLELLPSVLDVIRVSKPYKLASREFVPDDTVVRIASGKSAVGGGQFAVFAGPCAVESQEQVTAIRGNITPSTVA